MASKYVVSIFLMISSLFVVCYGQSDGHVQCITKLLPCKDALQQRMTNPPWQCCSPLKEAVANDPQCLCALINNAAILQQYNITKDDCLNLAKNCHANADISVCSKSSAPAPPATPTATATPSASPAPLPPCASSAITIGSLKEFAAISSIMLLAHSILG